MSSKDEEFLAELRAAFNVEAAEHVQAMVTGLMEMEKPSTPAAQRERVAVVFRAAHSLKGAARAVGLADVESQCHLLEDLFAGWKRQEGPPAPAAIDTAHRALSAVSAALGAPAVATVARQSAPPALAAEHGGPTPGDTVRIGIAKLDAMLVQAEELFAAKLAATQRAEDMRELAHRFEAWKHEWAAVESESRTLRQATVRPAPGDAGHVNGPALARLLDFADWSADHAKSLEQHVAGLARTAQQDRHVIERLVDDLLEDSKKLLLLPFATCAAPFPKLVRDLCRDQGKEAELVIRGEDVTIDKRILEELKDPLIHLLRNAVDHGVEPPDRRTAAGKPPRATITIAVTPVDGRKVEFTVSDDGAGIDVEKVKASAVRHGLLSPVDALAMGDAEARALALHADVSTSPMITKVSGRGLGLAIVRERAEKLGGTVSVESELGRGTSFRIVVPSILATLRGILIEVAGRRFVVPTAHVERVARVKADEVRTVEGRETIALDGRAVARARLADVLELPVVEGSDATTANVPVVVVFAGDQRVAFAVDAVLDEREVLVKRLGRPLVRVRNVSGATVLASGQVVPILNAVDLLKSARRSGGAPARAAATVRPPDRATKVILVAEDSITSRMMIKSILESAGYRVQTAVDGMDAFTQVRAGRFDLVVSDVEMPRLNGFDLTARIRADKKLSDLPIILVTALETREDRERGIDVGANAYLVKSSFDQDDLLDAVRRLV
jgi:two-component system chemotaxis sensor kinase CheA